MHRFHRPFALVMLLVSLWLAGCAAGGDPRQPIPTTLVPAAQPARRPLVMLPGRGDSLASLTATGVAARIQQAWPDTDVLLTGLTMPYYRQDQAIRRLHGEIIEPARRSGRYQQIWLAGISLGGLGALLYDQAHPDVVDGMLLFSPYLGDDAIHDEIRAAGGLASWNPGPVQPINADTFQRELWRSLQGWSERPRRTATIWLAYGDSERFRAPIELMSSQLPPGHVLMLPGHHNWTLWNAAISAVLQRVSATLPTAP
jgi:pimeloyl-ACP methyl ester carboxylesterase